VLNLATLRPDEYVAEVLPQTQALWAGARTFEEYVAEFVALTASGWGKRRFRTVGVRFDGVLGASLKRYERTLRCGTRTFRAVGIGAVFTPAALRGRGYATALLGAFLDLERRAGTDLAYLFSDIRPAFYESLGFVALPSRTLALRADMLSSERLDVVMLGAGDTAALRRVFDQLEAQRPCAFARTPLDWEWQRLRGASREHGGQPVALGVRRGRGLAAYVLGRRVPEADTFALDEFAFARDDDAHNVAPLLRAAAGDLRKIQGRLPPAPARHALPRGAVRTRAGAIPMLLPLSRAFSTAYRGSATLLDPDAGPCWSTDII
jgi:GNAT superfamily N-acetyltransferase